MSKRPASTSPPLETQANRMRISELARVDECGHDHATLDDLFLQRLMKEQTPGKPEMAKAVLSQCDLIRPEFGLVNSVAFLASWEDFYQQHQDEIDEIWKECLSKESFTPLRCIEQLRQNANANLYTGDNPPEAQDQVKATESAWTKPYEGSYPQILVDTILDEQLTTNNLKNRTNYLVAIQSSGAGKSRTAYEAGQYMYSVSVNLRESGGTGYPLRDNKLCDFIDRATSLPLLRQKRHCAAFIAGIFSAALSILKEGEINKLPFRERFDGKRIQFDQNAAEIAEKAVDPTAILNPPKTELEQYRHMLERTKVAIMDFAEAAGVRENAKEINDRLILFPIDECHTLQPKRSAEQDRSTYHALCSVLHDLLQTPIFVLFMSTASNTRQLAPPAVDDPSGRISNAGILIHHAPYTAFPFDVWKGVIVENTMNLDDVCKLSFLCRFGRPLWWTRWESGSESVRQDLIQFAMAKLNGNTDLHNVEKEAQFAALSTRHLLMFEPDRRPSEMNIKAYKDPTAQEYRQVASHMRTVHCIPAHREYMHTSTPSEPILAEAAAQLLSKSGCPQVKFLANDLNPLVGKGERGELAARLLCNLAHDAALEASAETINDNLQFSRPVPLIDFLKALLAPEWHPRLLGSRPVTGGNLPFSEAFKDCWVNFTHWSKMGDTSCLTTAALWKAIARGTAWQCCDGMPGIDQLIPFVRGRHAKLGCGTVSAIAIQDKDKKIALKVVDLDSEFPARLFADAPGETQQSFIFLTMQLGVQLSAAAAKKATKTATPVTPSKASVGVPPRIRNTRSSTADVRPGRYDITINGCSPTVYQVIKEEDRDHWAQLLAARSLKSELPSSRRTPPHEELLVRSKPFFWCGPHSFDWATDAGNRVDARNEEEQEEKVEFGKIEEDAL